MNLSDLRLVVGLKSNSSLHPNIFRNTSTNSSALTASFHGYPNLSGRATQLKLNFEIKSKSQYGLMQFLNAGGAIFFQGEM